MVVYQLSVFLENRIGTLAEITDILSKNNINLKAINIAETSDYGIVRIIADDTRLAARILSENDFVVSATPVCIAKVPDVPGGLSKVLSVFNENGISVEYMYSMFGLSGNMALMCFRVDDVETADKYINLSGFDLFDASEIGLKN